jgi:FixJ family two-component response regulator
LKKRILVDEPDIPLALKMRLENKGFKANTFNNPVETLTSSMLDLYDLLLDIKMPKKDR